MFDGGNEIKGVCTLEGNLLRVFPTELKERGKEADKLKGTSTESMDFTVESMNPLIIKTGPVSAKFRSVAMSDDKRGNVGTESRPAPTGVPSMKLIRTYAVKLHDGWREVHLHHKDSLPPGKEQRYTIVMTTDSGHTQRMPARFTGSEFTAVFYPNTVGCDQEQQAEQFWQSVRTATFWVEYSASKDAKEFRVSSVVEVSRPDI